MTPEEQALIEAAKALLAAQGGVMTTVASALPVAEAGVTTSEYKLLAPAGGLAGVAQAALALASAFGANLSAAQIAGIEGFVAVIVALYSAYAVSRGIRKSGTTG
jgi:hypothetical protein